MKRLAVVCLSALSMGLASCSSRDNAQTVDPRMDIPDGASQPDQPRDVRPPAASSGMSSDPNNPNGVPGPSSGLGTSPNRY